MELLEWGRAAPLAWCLSLCVVGILGSAVFACLKRRPYLELSGSGWGQEGPQARDQVPSFLLRWGRVTSPAPGSPFPSRVGVRGSLRGVLCVSSPSRLSSSILATDLWVCPSQAFIFHSNSSWEVSSRKSSLAHWKQGRKLCPSQVMSRCTSPQDF